MCGPAVGVRIGQPLGQHDPLQRGQQAKLVPGVAHWLEGDEGTVGIVAVERLVQRVLDGQVEVEDDSGRTPHRVGRLTTHIADGVVSLLDVGRRCLDPQAVLGEIPAQTSEDRVVGLVDGPVQAVDGGRALQGQRLDADEAEPPPVVQAQPGSRGSVPGRAGEHLDSAQGQIIEVAQPEAITVEGEQRQLEAVVRVVPRVVGHADVGSRVSQRHSRRVQVELGQQHHRGFGGHVVEEAGQLAVEDQVGQGLAARVARVQVVVEQLVAWPVAETDQRRVRDLLARVAEQVVVAEGGGDPGVHEVVGLGRGCDERERQRGQQRT